MKRVLVWILTIILAFTTVTVPALADTPGDGNIDSGSGGQMGGTVGNSSWAGGNDGVRVTVVDAQSGAPMSAPIDITNKDYMGVLHFGKVCKTQYLSGNALRPASAPYEFINPDYSLPRIVSSTTVGASLEAIRNYFCSEYAAQLVSNATGISYDDLLRGHYKLLLEPLVKIKYRGNHYVMTATEAALYDQLDRGGLKYDLGTVTHINLPLSIILETPDLGYQVWTGPKVTSTKLDNGDIISTLGVGIVKYAEEELEGEIEAPDYIYHTDTDVISSIHVSASGRLTPDNPATVQFEIMGRRYTINNIVVPAGDSQVVWVKWRTPAEPTTITIDVSVSGGFTGETAFQAQIIDLNDNIPPDPTADDTAPRYSVPAVPTPASKSTASWGVWSCYWVSDWQLVGLTWVDMGDWEYEYTPYEARLTAAMTTMPDDIVPTASGKSMKSGYGIKTSVTARMSTDAPGSHVTDAQNVLTTFPEFSYQNYSRLLERIGGGFQFRENPYSTYLRRVHFTPIWFPDQARYVLFGQVMDAWTPVGMLQVNVSDDVSIDGNLFDDWYTSRE